jgi:hypothetical protein
MTKRFLINYDNSIWCGGDLNVVVYADSADEALYKAEDHMEEAQRELFSDEISEGYLEEEFFTNVISCEELNEDHEEWSYYQDPTQSSFYPEIK